MKIAVVHSFYRSQVPSGENQAVVDQVRALSRGGHDVLVLGDYSDLASRRRGYELLSAARVTFGMGTDLTHDLQAFSPDVVHIHNTFPNLGIRWIRRWTSPTVVTLHNYRSVCANGLLFREGHTCRECVERSTLASLQHGCYRDSRVATLPVWASGKLGVGVAEVVKSASAVVSPSEFALDIIGESLPFDVPAYVVPNFVSLPHDMKTPDQPRWAWIAAGRLATGKGFAELIDMWPDKHQLDIFGSGPEFAALKELRRGKDITIHGWTDRIDLLRRLKDYQAFVFPGRSSEVLPTVVLEASTCGVPVIAWDGTAAASIVREYKLGLTYQDSHSLDEALRFVASSRDTFSRNCSQVGAREWSEDHWLARMEKVFEEAINTRSAF